MKVELFKDKKHKYLSAHRLVAKAFISNDDNLPQINHIDKIRDNNCVENLEWCDAEYNTRYSHAKKVCQFDLSKKLIKIWDCIRDIERELGFDHSNISKCCKNHKKMYNSYWEYFVGEGV